MKVNDRKEGLLYFHGNAEDIGASISFMQPIQDQTGLNIYVMEYPTYGTYTNAYSHRISDGIKRDSEDFAKFLLESKLIDKA